MKKELNEWIESEIPQIPHKIVEKSSISPLNSENTAYLETKFEKSGCLFKTKMSRIVSGERDKSLLKRDKSLLIGIGLVIIGLFAGILVTLWVANGVSRDLVRPSVVERVELGAGPAPGYVSVPQSEVPTAYLDALSLNEVFKDVSRRVTPAVVFIEVVSNGPTSSIFEQFGGDFQAPPSQSLGSGVIISDEGYIVTNNHVVEDAALIQVTLGDKRQFEAKVIGSDPTTDLAVIKIEPVKPIPVIVLGNSKSLEVGEWVMAVGNPFRLTSTVTAGIVSALSRQVNVINDRLGIESFIQTDAAINPGNSGGAVVNLRGELVGIATAIATETGSNEGYGFAVPVDLMERVVKDLIRYGEVRRGYLGVSIGAMTAGRARALGMDSVQGVFLMEVQKGLAGDKAGLKAGDVLLSIDGTLMTEPNQLQSAIALFAPGDKVPVEIWRGGKVRNLIVTLLGRETPGYDSWLTDLDRQNQPPVPDEPDVPDNAITQFEDWGAGLAEINSRLRRGLNVAHGVYVALVTKDGLFDVAGLSRGMVITHINDAPVFNVATAGSLLSAESDLLIQAIRPDRTIVFFEISKEEN